MKRQRGFFFLGYVLGVIAVLGVLSGIMALSKNNSVGPLINNKAMEITTQAQLIRSKLLNCVTAYPSGDNGTAFHLPYPGSASWSAVSGLTCPGAPAASNNLWSGLDGVFLPQPPAGFETAGWEYINDVSSVRIRLRANNAASTAAWNAAITKALTKFGATEASRATVFVANDAIQIVITN